MELTVIISLITALAAIVSPLLVAVINNKHNLRIKQIEIEQDMLKNIDLHEREVLENAFSGIGILMSWEDEESIKEACKNILMAVAYVDSDTGDMLREVVSLVMEPDTTIPEILFFNICENMKKEIAKRTHKKREE